MKSFFKNPVAFAKWVFKDAVDLVSPPLHLKVAEYRAFYNLLEEELLQEKYEKAREYIADTWINSRPIWSTIETRYMPRPEDTKAQVKKSDAYGCYNREPYKDMVTLPRTPVQIHLSLPVTCVPFRMARDCQYTLTKLGQADARCVGCSWRADQVPN